MIRGLKFTQIGIRLMGGEGSGHHDHVGRPGSVGGSAPSSQFVSMITRSPRFQKMPDGYKKPILQVASQIPDSHIEGIPEVAWEGKKVDELREMQSPAEGISWVQAARYPDGTLVLIPGVATEVSIAHEVGHHVWHRQISPNQTDLVNVREDYIKGSNLWTGKTGKNIVKKAGLRQYSFSRKEEFWADSYSIRCKAQTGNKKFLGYVENYRTLFPNTSEILDRIFK